MDHPAPIASIVMAAGRGSRMKGYSGNKTLLPLIPSDLPFEGTHPILCHVLQNLPVGPKALIVHHCKDDVISATGQEEVVYCEQPTLNGTGGAILAAKEFVHSQTSQTAFIITMGDVPFVSASTYQRLARQLASTDLTILGFKPRDKKKYGVLEIENGKVRKITEWQFWKDYPTDVQETLSVCNSGIYAVSREILDHYLPILESRPQVVYKEIDGQRTAIEEYFITDLIEYLVSDGCKVGYLVVDDEMETMGIDDVDALQEAQACFRSQLKE